MLGQCRIREQGDSSLFEVSRDGTAVGQGGAGLAWEVALGFSISMITAPNAFMSTANWAALCMAVFTGGRE